MLVCVALIINVLVNLWSVKLFKLFHHAYVIYDKEKKRRDRRD